MTKARINLGVVLVVIAGVASPASAQGDSGRAVDEWSEFLGNVNSSGLLEPAGSHGSLGVALGAGASSHAVPDPGLVTASLLEKEDAEAGDAYVVPRIWVTKGLPWPVDVGLTAGGDDDRSFTQAAGYLQWTVFEALARPALALRGSYGRLFGLPGTEVETTTVEVVGSYGFLRYFTVYGNVGASRHDVTVTARREDSLAFLLTETETETRYRRVWTGTSRAAGLRVTVLPPFVSVTAEAQETAGDRRSYAAKLTVGM